MPLHKDQCWWRRNLRAELRWWHALLRYLREADQRVWGATSATFQPRADGVGTLVLSDQDTPTLQPQWGVRSKSVLPFTHQKVPRHRRLQESDPPSQHSPPLDFIPTADDCSIDEAAAEHLNVEYNVNYASCIGSLIYLAMTWTDIIHAVNKLAKFSRGRGKNHFEALLLFLRYLRDNCYLRIMFYSNLGDAPLIKMLHSQNIEQHHPFFGFSDSSWNDDIDSGRSTWGAS